MHSYSCMVRRDVRNEKSKLSKKIIYKIYIEQSNLRIGYVTCNAQVFNLHFLLYDTVMSLTLFELD